jgi:hypothetical protein
MSAVERTQEHPGTVLVLALLRHLGRRGVLRHFPMIGASVIACGGWSGIVQ